MSITKQSYICPCCKSNPSDITNESDKIYMLCVKCGPIAIRRSQKSTLQKWDSDMIDKVPVCHVIYDWTDEERIEYLKYEIKEAKKMIKDKEKEIIYLQWEINNEK